VHCLISMNSGQNIDKILMMRRRRQIWVGGECRNCCMRRRRNIWV
jgi:hypothetical protein